MVKARQRIDSEYKKAGCPGASRAACLCAFSSGLKHGPLHLKRPEVLPMFTALWLSGQRRPHSIKQQVQAPSNHSSKRQRDTGFLRNLGHRRTAYWTNHGSARRGASDMSANAPSNTWLNTASAECSSLCGANPAACSARTVKSQPRVVIGGRDPALMFQSDAITSTIGAHRIRTGRRFDSHPRVPVAVGHGI